MGDKKSEFAVLRDNKVINFVCSPKSCVKGIWRTTTQEMTKSFKSNFSQQGIRADETKKITQIWSTFVLKRCKQGRQEIALKNF